MARSTSTDRRQDADIASHEEIAAKAYELYTLRGRLDGYDLNDWLAAEAELLSERREADR